MAIAFVKSFRTYKTIKQAIVLSNALVLDGLEADTSTVTVKGVDVNRSDIGNWLVIDAKVYAIAAVKPQKDRTMLTITFPLDAFSRPLELPAVQDGQSIGGFTQACLQANWAECDDPEYAMPYLTVSSADPTPFVPPELDNNGCFQLPEYCRLMRKAYRVWPEFVDAGNTLRCTIVKQPTAQRQVVFNDGRSQLQSVDYSSSGIAKLTVFCDVDTGQTDAEGNPILERQRSEWYLSAAGTISQSVPAIRASGKWDVISVKKPEEISAKVTEAFAKNKKSHKLEFWSTIDLKVHDDCTFMVYGELLNSYISYKRKSSSDGRFYYKSGELATTATEKLRGVLK